MRTGKLSSLSPSRWRIAPILAVTMILLAVTFIVTTTLLDIARARRIYQEELRNRGLSLAGQLDDQLADPLFLANVEDIEKISTLVASQPDIEYVQVFSADGLMLVDTSADGFQSLGRQVDVFGLRALADGERIDDSEGDMLRVAQPVVVGGQTVGGVQIGLRSDVLDEQVRAIVIEHLIQGFLLIVLAGIVAYVIARGFSRPVGALVAATDDMASGKLNTRVANVQGGELRTLAGSFNTMAQELQTTISELQQSRRRIVSVQEGVRRDIASHLHGQVQSRMLVLRTQLYRMARRDDARSDDAAQLDEIVNQLDDLIQNDITLLSRRLYPSILRRGLIPALQSLADQFEPSFAVRLEIGESYRQREAAGGGPVPEAVKLAAYRIAEDALTNVLKHAAATMVRIRLDIEPDERLRLAIEDDGKGFDIKDSRLGLGLEAMQDYASAVSGSCDIWSVPGRGTAVTADLPIEE